MVYKTFAEIKTKVYLELDLETEDFVQANEFLGYVNDGIAIAENTIHKLGLEDDYFLTKTTLSLVTSASDIVLPANLYMNKIRRVLYNSGSKIVEIPRLRGRKRFENHALLNQASSGVGDYMYLIRNDAATAVPVMELIPAARETSTGVITIWYIREASKWVSTSTVNSALKCDLPTVAMQFLYQYLKYRCYEKEGHANGPDAKVDLAQIQKDMISGLEQMVEDEDTIVEMDLSHYDESN